MVNVNLRVVSSTYDAHSTPDGNFPGNSATANVLWIGTQNGGARVIHTGAIFEDIDIPSGATIDDADVAYKDVDFGQTNHVQVYCEDVSASPEGYGTDDFPVDRAITTASTEWNVSAGSEEVVTTPDLADEFQEILDSYSGLTNAGVVLLGLDDDVISDFVSFDGDSAAAPLLDLNYTAGGGGGATVPIFDKHYRQMRVA